MAEDAKKVEKIAKLAIEKKVEELTNQVKSLNQENASLRGKVIADAHEIRELKVTIEILKNESNFYRENYVKYYIKNAEIESVLNEVKNNNK